MALDATQIAKVKDWIIAKSHGDGCSWCGGHDFAVRSEEIDLEDEAGGALAPLIAVQCNGCQQTFFFSSHIL